MIMQIELRIRIDLERECRLAYRERKRIKLEINVRWSHKVEVKKIQWTIDINRIRNNKWINMRNRNMDIWIYNHHNRSRFKMFKVSKVL